MRKTLIWLSLAACIPQSLSTCFSQSLLPKALTNTALNNQSGYYAVVSTDEALFVGGGTRDSKVRGSHINKRSSVITRIQLDTFSTVWSMIYQADNDKAGAVTALSLNPS